jgi:starch-binding outer membrane protein, SusD/RagB family
MNLHIKFKTPFFVLAATSIVVGSCTKLHETLTSTLTPTDANKFSGLFLQSAYNDIGVVYEDLGNVLQLEEVSTDECFIPIRGTDWYDGGYHVALHLHNWGRSTIPLLETEFQALNKISFDATTVLGTDATPDQLGQARFIRAISLYQQLELFGQFPIRQPGDNLLLASKVYSGDSACQFIISELTAAIPVLNPGNGVTLANQNAARALLMRMYLNHGTFNTRAAPTFADADMQQVITLGTQIMTSGGYSYDPTYFGVFANGNSASSEAIFSLPNAEGANTSSGFYPNMQNEWYSALHYNQYDALAPQAGWNGFSTMGEFYNTFGVNGTTLTQTPKDSSQDVRLGMTFMKGVTDQSGMRPGMMINQQYDQNDVALKDRKGLPLYYTNGDEVPASIDASLLPNLESSGYRVLKYTPDFTTGQKSYQVPGNYYVLLRYADVVLMVAEAKMRQASPDNTGALTLVNALRTARKAAPLTTMTLNNPATVYDPNTLLAERGRELYWEGVRRIDLERFGVWNIGWRLKPTDAGNYYLFPIPAAELSNNPNLIPNLQGSAY